MFHLNYGGIEFQINGVTVTESPRAHRGQEHMWVQMAVFNTEGTEECCYNWL